MLTKSDDSAVATVSAVSNKQFTVTLTKDGSTNVELSSGNTVVTIPVTVSSEPSVSPELEVWPTNISNEPVKLTPGSTTTLAVTKLSPTLSPGQSLDVKLKTHHFEDDTVNSKYITASYDPSVGELGSVIVHASSDLPTDGSVSGFIDVASPIGANSSVGYEAVSESSMPKITDLQIASPITGTADTGTIANDIIIKPTSIIPSDAKMNSNEVAFGNPKLNNDAMITSSFDNDGNLVINASKATTGTIPLIYSLGKDYKTINLELDIN